MSCEVHDPDPSTWTAEHVEHDDEFQHGFTDLTVICRRCNLVLCARLAHAALSTGAPELLGIPEEE